MRVKEVVVEVGLTLSPRQYESVKCHTTVAVELAEGDDPDAALNLARSRAREHVMAEAETILREAFRQERR